MGNANAQGSMLCSEMREMKSLLLFFYVVSTPFLLLHSLLLFILLFFSFLILARATVFYLKLKNKIILKT